MKKIIAIIFIVILLAIAGVLLVSVVIGIDNVTLPTSAPTAQTTVQPATAQPTAQQTTVQPTPQLATPTPTPAPLPANTIPGLISIGDNDGAYAKLKDGIANEFTLINSSTLQFKSWLVWNIVKNTVKDFALPLISGIIALMIAILLIRLLYDADNSVQMTITPFEFGSINFKNDGVAKSISNEVNDSLYQYYSAHQVDLFGVTDLQPKDKQFKQLLKLTNRSEIPTALPTTVPSQASSLFDFIFKIFPPKTFTISGQLEYDSTKGVGLSITFDDNNPENIAKSTTFWEKDLDIYPLKKLAHEDTPSNSNPKPADKKSMTLLAENNSTSSKKQGTQPDKQTSDAAQSDLVQSDEYYSRFRLLAKVASAWVYYRILKSKKESLVKDYFGTDDFKSIQYFILFCISYDLYIKFTQEDKSKQEEEKVNADELIDLAKRYLTKSVHNDQHNSIANFNLGWLFFYSQLKEEPKDVVQNEFTMLLTQAINSSSTSDPININANYCLANYFLDYYLGQLHKQRKGIFELGNEARERCFEKYFKSACEGAAKSSGMTENSKLAFYIPCLVDYVAFGEGNWTQIEKLKKKKKVKKITQFEKLELAVLEQTRQIKIAIHKIKIYKRITIKDLLARRSLRQIENKKFDIQIHKNKENNVDFYYNLACFYSLMSKSEFLSKRAISRFQRRYYKEDENSVVYQPLSLTEFSLRNLEIACECDFQRVLKIHEKDKWLDNIRENKKSNKYDRIIQKYITLNDVINPKEEELDKKKENKS